MHQPNARPIAVFVTAQYALSILCKHKQQAPTLPTIQITFKLCGTLHHATTHAVVRICRPFAVVIGGAKVADKIGVLRQLIDRANVLLVGGRMAFTFLAAQGVAVGQTAIEEAWLEAAREMLDSAKQKVRSCGRMRLELASRTSDLADSGIHMRL